MPKPTGAGDPRAALDELLDLIAAIDRRIPQVERVGETDIARDAAALRIKALRRIDELRTETGGP
jgi:hypothetical protein